MAAPCLKSESLGYISTPSSPIVYVPAYAWNVNNRGRRFIRFSERAVGRESDLLCLANSAKWLLERQDERGSFHSDAEYSTGDTTDDQLGAAAVVARFLNIHQDSVCSRDNPVERAVRFHLQHLVNRDAEGGWKYSRYHLARDSAGDWCNTLWCLWGAALLMEHDSACLTPATRSELLTLMADYWAFLSWYPVRDENPCHNQLLEYCKVGMLYARAISSREVEEEVLHYYRHTLRRLRVYDCGHAIYTEYNQWDAHYGMLSWMALEYLADETCDKDIREDAGEMASYFNERVSSGGYYWGGSRRDEAGIDEFIHLPWKYERAFGLDRLLLPEPSHLWQSLIMNGHYGRSLLTRLDSYQHERPSSAWPTPPTRWHYRRGCTSVCLRQNTHLHHFSSHGLEIIAALIPQGMGSGLLWKAGGKWQQDPLQIIPPSASEGHRYAESMGVENTDVTCLCSRQRGATWETRQWWLSDGSSLLWIVQAVSHADIACEQLDFLLGNPVLTVTKDKPTPVTFVQNGEGDCLDTQGEAGSLASSLRLTFGDVSVAATAPLIFARPSTTAFHTFPTPIKLENREDSNQLRVRAISSPEVVFCRTSHFIGIEIGQCCGMPVSTEGGGNWEVAASLGQFRATDVAGRWSYHIEVNGKVHSLPDPGFRFYKS